MSSLYSKEDDYRNPLKIVDPEIAAAIERERRRQQDHLELIASENLVSRAVLQAQGSILTNKYAEGYPGSRYYGGCIHVDVAEELACKRACSLFGAEHANVQPHAGASANLAAYMAVLKPGDKLMGMDLAHGGHLTHGSPASITGRYYEAHSYGVNRETGLIELQEVRSRALAVEPKLIVAGASSYPRQIDFPGFLAIAREVGALLLVDMAHIAGLVAAGLHPSPVPCADIITSTTHKTLRGPRGGLILSAKAYARAVDKAIFPGLQGGPLMHIIAAKAVAFKEAQTKEFKEYQKKVINNAAVMADTLVDQGFDLVTGSTETHLVLLDLRSQKITGQEAEILLEKVGITANKNAIPFDPRSPQVTSGLRLGTPAVTSRGMGAEQLKEIACLIGETIDHRSDKLFLGKISRRVKELCSAYPVDCI